MVLGGARAAVLLLTPLPLLLGATAAADPFPTRDQNPLLAGLGLPHAMPARVTTARQWQLGADLNWGSSAIIQSNAREALTVDAETRELRATLAYGLRDRLTMRLQIPYRSTGAGSLDGFIDDWHGWFGLPEGERPRLPTDRYRISYRQDGATLLDLRTSGSGLADLTADLGYQLIVADKTSLAAWLSLKLPTGDADELTGSGATDVSLVVAGGHDFANRWSVFGQLGASYLGEGDLLPAQQRSSAWSAMAGVGFDLTPRLELKLQLDAHDAAYDGTTLDFLGDTAFLTLGGSYRFDSGWQLDAGVSEDVVVNGSPDVVFVLGVSKR